MERLQKIIANKGYCSRRKAEKLIETGHVYVNDEKITELGFKAKTSDQITIDGKLLQTDQKEYYLLNKPAGVISSVTDDKKRKTVCDIISSEKRIYPIGRLDYDTTGLLILTNDGELANLIMHPKNNVEKVYVAKINGKLKKEQLLKLQSGIMIEEQKTAPAKIKIISYDKTKDNSIVRVTIHEGKNHQVKKMLEKVGSEVLKLKREKVAFLDLTGLKIGQYRKLTTKEVKKLYSLGM